MTKKLAPKELTPFINPDLAEMARKAGIEPGELVGTGHGMIVFNDCTADYGECSWCGGRYIGSAGAGWGICNGCGAV